MAKLKAFLPSLDGLEKTVADLYREEPDVGYLLDAEESEGWSVANVANATSGLGSARRERDAAKKELGALKAERDRLTAQLAQMEADLEAATAGKLDKKAIEEQVKKQMERAHTAQLQALTGERDTHAKTIEALEREIGTSMVDALIAQAASGGKWSFSPKVIGPHVRGRLRVTKTEDGKREVAVLDATGEPKLGANGKPATLDDLFAEYTRDSDFSQYITRKDQQPPNRGSDPKPGTGGNRGGNGAIVFTESDLQDFKSHERLMAQAEKEGRQFTLPGA